jgi:hypothetical protein
MHSEKVLPQVGGVGALRRRGRDVYMVDVEGGGSVFVCLCVCVCV